MLGCILENVKCDSSTASTLEQRHTEQVGASLELTAKMALEHDRKNGNENRFRSFFCCACATGHWGLADLFCFRTVFVFFPVFVCVRLCLCVWVGVSTDGSAQVKNTKRKTKQPGLSWAEESGQNVDFIVAMMVLGG